MHKKAMLSMFTVVGYAGLGVLMVNAPDTRFRLLVMCGYIGFSLLFYCTLQVVYQADDARERLAKLQAKHNNEKAQLERQKAAWKHATSDPLNTIDYELNRMRWLLSELELKEYGKPNDNGHTDS